MKRVDQGKIFLVCNSGLCKGCSPSIPFKAEWMFVENKYIVNGKGKYLINIGIGVAALKDAEGLYDESLITWHMLGDGSLVDGDKHCVGFNGMLPWHVKHYLVVRCMPNNSSRNSSWRRLAEEVQYEI